MYVYLSSQVLLNVLEILIEFTCMDMLTLFDSQDCFVIDNIQLSLYDLHLDIVDQDSLIAFVNCTFIVLAMIIDNLC